MSKNYDSVKIGIFYSYDINALKIILNFNLFVLFLMYDRKPIYIRVVLSSYKVGATTVNLQYQAYCQFKKQTQGCLVLIL